MGLSSRLTGAGGANPPDEDTLAVLVLLLGLELSWGALSGRRALLVLGLLLVVPALIVWLSVVAWYLEG
jgi:hypothetical protein